MNETQFNEYAEKLARRYLAWEPHLATFMGIHDYDHQLSQYSPDTIAEKYGARKAALADLESCRPERFSKEGQIDYTLVTQLLKSQLVLHERVEEHRRNPRIYLEAVMEGIFSLIVKDFAPLEERLERILGRVRETPRVIAEGRANLQPARVPRVWAETALEQARLGPGLFEGLLPSMAADFQGLQEKLAGAGSAASAAMQEFAAYLEHEILPAAAGDFAAGEELFNYILREQHLVEYDAAELFSTGRRLFDETKAAMEAVAREIDPGCSVKEILEKAKDDHPAAENLLAEYHKAIEEARRYVIERGIASIPPDESLRIIETPGFLKPVIPYAAYIPPGIFEKKLEGLFLVTTPGDEAGPEAREEKLKGAPYSKLPLTALHEAYPGHHLQLAWAVRLGTTARKTGFMLSHLFVEGWAFYCEELMERIGYLNSPVQRLSRLADQLWRAARIILDVSLHCRGMGVPEAVDFLVENCRLQPADALAEVRRYTATPTQPQTYLMGKLEINKIVEEYRRRRPDASMREMHDAILSCGAIPPKLIRKQLFSP
jgi:uncharacterized protein (DUF885 family)